MKSIVVDEHTKDMLLDLQEQARLCAADGKVLGYFLPVVDASHYREANSPTPVEELRRREAAGGGRPLTDILADFERRA